MFTSSTSSAPSYPHNPIGFGASNSALVALLVALVLARGA